MVGEDDLRLCLGLRATAGVDPSVSNSGGQLPLASDCGDQYVNEMQDRSRGSGEGEDKDQGKGSDEEDGGGAGASGAGRKKLRLSKQQASILEGAFKQQHTLNPKQKLALAKELNLRPRQVEVWFQNRRARTKLKKTEVDCELLKRCCESLSEENRRLQRELLELRALRRPPPHVYMQVGSLPPPPPPPTTVLAICPACERAGTSTAAAGTQAESRYKHHSASLPLQRQRILLS